VRQAAEVRQGSVDGRVRNGRQPERLPEVGRGGQNKDGGVLTGWQMGAIPKPADTLQLEAAYERFKEPMLQKARSWFPALRGMELDLYQSAWEGLLRNGDIEDLERYLKRAIFTKGLDELRRRGRRPTVSLERLRLRKPGTRRLSRGLPGAELVPDGITPLPEDQAQLREDVKSALELLDELTPLQQRIVKLRWGWQVPRKEAARLLGISERALRREIEDAATVIARNAELVEQGRWCEQKRSLILAYSFEILSPSRAAKAAQHLDTCPACRQLALQLRRRIVDVGAVVPLPLSLLQPVRRDLVAPLGEHLASVRETVSDVVAVVKHHVLGVFARTPAAEAATTQLAGGGLRGSGSMLAAVAACLVAGGSAATYCTLEGVPAPLRSLAQLERQHERGNERARSRAAAVDAPSPLGAQAIPQGTSGQGVQNPGGSPDAQQAPSPIEDQSPQEAAPSPAPKGTREFGAGSAAASRAQPAAAPSSGGGEFTP
jgi:RNA polymerase sigma factor (sigma-70 family)